MTVQTQPAILPFPNLDREPRPVRGALITPARLRELASEGLGLHVYRLPCGSIAVDRVPVDEDELEGQA